MSDITEKNQEEKDMEQYFFRASAEDFGKIPGSPIAYWPSNHMRDSFGNHNSLGEIARPKQGLATTDNGRFLRYWFECLERKSCFTAIDSESALESERKWFPCQKGGGFRKWYGNNDYLVNWENDGEEIKKIVIDRYGSASKRVVNEHLYFKQGITWSTLSSSSLSMRYVAQGFIFETKGSMCFFDNEETLFSSIAFCNTNIVNPLLQCISPTLDFHEGPVGKLPIASRISSIVVKNSVLAIAFSKQDWDGNELSWDFSELPLLSANYKTSYLKQSYGKIRVHWSKITLNLQQLEQENNRIFIEAYGLQDELTPEVPLKEITLTCNPHYRYKGEKSDEELEALLLADTMREFISYAVGCMFGRYSLDKEGLILANQGDTLAEYFAKTGTVGLATQEHGNEGVSPSFMPDEDNVIPLIDFEGDWFEDDISERFKQFLKVTFGEANFAENLSFIEKAIGKDIKKFFLKDFYADHVKRYKKRPIYWLFSSQKGSFNALVYIHRYQPDTASIVLNDYLREFRTKLEARKESYEQVEISASASQKDKTQAIKAITKINKVLEEVNDYEHDVLYPLAGKKIDIDLDDGVKHNYPLFGKALKKVTGLS